MKSPVLIPLVMIPVSKKMIMGFMIVWLLGFFVALTARIIKHLDFRKEVLIDALTILLPYIGFPRTLNALAIINEY